MSFSSLLKQLKKRWRQKRRWLSLGFWILLFGTALLISTQFGNKGDKFSSQLHNAIDAMSKWKNGHVLTPVNENLQQQFIAELNKSSDHRRVELKTVYVCGEEIQQLGKMAPDKILSQLNDHPQWKASITKEGTVRIMNYVEDLSPDCKKYGYIGLDKNGNLSLFKGLPTQEHVIRTFFQINIEHLESSLPAKTVRQLQEGIRIKDLDEYNSVLSTFSDFAVDETNKVMKTSS